ncbi:MAG: alpha/beta hydrolase [Nocardioidaceae bacterium]
MNATAVEGDRIAFRLPGYADATGVRLWQDVELPEPLELNRVETGWELRLPIPPVDRLEYLYEVSTAAGRESITDPTNPLVVAGAFGDHSWLPFGDYQPPAWLEARPALAAEVPLLVPDTGVGEIAGRLWSPYETKPGERLPLLVVHDGPEFDELAALTTYAGAVIAEGTLPRFRVALLDPGDRNARYAANPDYADALVDEVLPAIAGTEGAPVLMGASLGALAALHAHWRHPGAFGGLFLQSGSFFTPRTDAMERDFAFFRPVTRFVRRVATTKQDGVPASLTCGSAEENVQNNRLMADRLRDLGWPTAYAESRDAHNFTAWRDMLHPHLTELLAHVWR